MKVCSPPKEKFLDGTLPSVVAPVLCLPCVNIVLPHSLRWFCAIGLSCAGSVLLAVYQLLWPFEVFYPMGLIALFCVFEQPVQGLFC